MYLSDVATFFKCLNSSVRKDILKVLNMLDTSIDTNLEVLHAAIMTIKAMRNAVAHNEIVFDARFKDRDINQVLKLWVEKETNIKNITLHTLVDYVIVMCTLLKRFDYTGTKAKEFVQRYVSTIDIFRKKVSADVYDKVFSNRVRQKIISLQNYVQA